MKKAVSHSPSSSPIDIPVAAHNSLPNTRYYHALRSSYRTEETTRD